MTTREKKERFSSLEVIEPIAIKVRKSRKVSLWVTGLVNPKVIHVSGMSTVQIQRTFVLGSSWGWDRKIEALTIE